ncbi:unconventional myosin-Va isoform X2 [Chrysoperla carnea]|uniref:unconventional myosin-Va isoform X2 n=1 Tax=Chrysoperla carnea TaxID=189513 RepID=UPI001D07EBE0|nr:unconventional myosin-Va isoform X2 [Chrysoperla carnea]
MTTIELYTKGAKVWVPHPKQVWESAEISENYDPKKNVISIITESNITKTVNIKTDADLPPLCNPSILIGENDLTSLSYLHEPAVLYNLQVRFCQQKAIYTYCGIVLVAINPYDELPIYGLDIMRTYRGQAMGDLDPHVFAVAEEAYTRLEREQRHQSVVVSGESGAGKTVSAKYVMRYFATVSGSGSDETETYVEKKVLASSPIMEAIGNAKTTRNDNSSRFGKYIEIHFNKQYHIIGASMRTYLLEKSRVVFQAPDERNYHIFYQLCAARKQLTHLRLEHQDNFHYLKQGQAPHIDGVDDLITFEETVNALTVLGFSKNEQNDMFKIYAAILHLGNVRFRDIDLSGDHSQEDSEGCGISEEDQSLHNFAELLDINLDEMRQWLCTRKITSMREVFLKPMTIEQATISRDALAKHIYAALFNWIVKIVNKALESSKTCHKFIGVLDIYGFETFEVNSFEQFCINYANEKLQQQFNQHVFKLEQEEYIKEEIEWKMIDFYDNQPCIDLIEAKLGILELLDEECRMPKGSDSSWTEKLYSKCSKYQHFKKPRFGTSAFIISHFADQVQYESNGFLEKNRDTIIEEQITVLRGSQNKLFRKLFATEDDRKLSIPNTRVKISAAKTLPSTQKSHKKTVGSQFRDSLNMLMETLNATTPHYVRCIKPNDTKTPFEYNPQRAVQQLRACGVLETVRISAAGFPSRWFYDGFFNRYRVLCRFKDINRFDMKKTCERILQLNIKAVDKYQFGKTKIFFRAGQVAYLEKLRAEKLKKCCIIVQSQLRAFIWRKKYLKIRNSILNIQRYGRGYLGRQKAVNLRRTKAAIVLQKYIRGWIKRVQFLRTQRCILGIQTHARGMFARQRFMAAKYNAKAIIIQRYVRGWLCRKRYAKQQRRIVVCQSAVRRFLARRLYRKLRVEARSVEHVKKLNKGLENKIISLQQKIEEINKENHAFKNAHNELLDLKLKLDSLKGIENEYKKLNALLQEKDKQYLILQEKLKQEQDEKMDLIQEQEKYRTIIEQEKLKWTNENQKLMKEIENLKQIVASNQLGAEEILKTRLEQEKLILMNEQEQERTAYQQLLREYNALEQHCENLESKLSRYSRSGLHPPSSATSTIDRHMRSLSDVSNISNIDNMDESLRTEDDYGYGSVRSNSTVAVDSHQRLDTIDWKRGDPPVDPQHKAESSPPQFDLGLVLKLQQKLKAVESENNRLLGKIDQMEREGSPNAKQLEAAVSTDTIRVSELEMENAKLLKDLNQLRENLCDKTVMEQITALQDELTHRREEVIQLRSVFANQTANIKSFASSTYGPDVDIVNEDGELVLAYEAQKKINQQLEIELTSLNQRCREQETEYRNEIKRLREDNERQQKLLSANLTESPLTQTEAYMQHEITRVTSENLDLNEKYDNVANRYRILKKEARAMARKLQELGLLESTLDRDRIQIGERTDLVPLNASTQAMQADNENKDNKQLVVRKKEREYQGMFEYKKEDEAIIIRHLIADLKPRVAVQLLPGLPSYIVFMCIRHTDFINDDEKLKSLLALFMSTIRKIVKKRGEDLETTVLWLSNTLRLLHNLKQYSGDATFQHSNTPKQNEQCLRNFDLAEYRQVLSDLAVWIYQICIRTMEKKIQPLIVPAILEHDAITNISGNKPGLRNRSASVGRDINEAAIPTHKAPQALVNELTNFHRILGFYGVDPDIITQVFRQKFFFICATALNNLLLRKEFCHWSKGCQIRYNVSNLEMWARDKRLDDKNILDTLQPIIQAAHLLQARKTSEDVTSVCDMCSALTAEQICKILQLYTPLDDFEERVPPSFIKQVQAKLKERSASSENKEQQGKLLLDSKQNFPVRFSFNPSTICLEDIEVPEILNLPMLKKV